MHQVLMAASLSLTTAADYTDQEKEKIILTFSVLTDIIAGA